MWQLTSRWVSELQSLIEVFGFGIGNLSGLPSVLNTILPWVFLGSLVSNHRDELVLMSRCIPVFTLVGGKENNLWFFEHSSDRFLPVGRTSCLECAARTDWPAWQDDLTAGCCKELTVGYEWLALLSSLFLRQTGRCTDEIGPLHFACWTSCFFWGALPQPCLCPTAQRAAGGDTEWEEMTC